MNVIKALITHIFYQCIVLFLIVEIKDNLALSRLSNWRITLLLKNGRERTLDGWSLFLH